MKKRRYLKKGLAILLTATMVVGLMPGTGTLQAQAEALQVAETTSTTKTIAGLGTSVIADPTDPGDDTTKAWAGSYVYYGNYNADGDGTAEPVKYRVLDASTTDYSAEDTEGNKAETMLLDCDSILYYQKFDNDGTANEGYEKANDWAGSDVKSSLNGDGFLHKDGVFTTAEKNAIAASTVDSHELTTDSTTGVKVADWTQSTYVNYVALTGEQIFLLDAEDVSNGAYGYSMTDTATENRKKTGSSDAYWWLRSADDDYDSSAGVVHGDGDIGDDGYVRSSIPGVSPALNLNLQSVLFSSVISGTAGETGAEYKLTLLDDGMTIGANGDATRYGKTVTIPYHISGNNSSDATQISVLILDKEYTAGNTNGATVLDYQKLKVDSFSASGTGTYTLPDSLYRKGCGTDYHMYILAEDVNEEKETDYASTPFEIIPTWKAPTVKQMNFGTKGIIDPAVPNSASDPWKGCYVYYGNYNGSPVKYRVLDASTTDYSEDGTTNTMLLDCDSILYYQKFDEDGTANEGYEKANDWAGSDVKSSLNGDDFLYKEGVFTTAEKNAIAASTVDTHTLKTDSETGVNVTDCTQYFFKNYVALTREQIFLLDAEDVSNGAYGYSMTDGTTENRKKTGSSAAYWWLRSAYISGDNYAGFIHVDAYLNYYLVDDYDPGVSPALNLNLSSVIFSSASAQSDSGQAFDKSLALTSSSTEIGTVANTDWKLTLKDDEKSVALTEGRSVTKASDETITVPYTYTDKEEATDREKVNQISVMITDKAYGSKDAQILYYGALQDIKNAEGNTSTVAEASTGTGTFALPSSLTGALGTDYHIYLLAEHVNADNSTDYASEPVEVTAIKTPIDSVTVTGLKIDTPTPEQPLQTEIDITTDSTSVSSTAALTWKKEETVVTGNAQWKTTYQAYVTLTAKDGYTFIDATGVIANGTLNGSAVDSNKITLNNDGTQMIIDCGAYTTATRKTTGAEAPEAPTQFANYYTADDVLSSTELGKAAKVTLEGTTQPNPEEMEVEWTIVDAEGNATTYDATPETTNIFKWTVKASQYADYDKGAAVLEGTVAIKNKDYTPVTISGSDKTLTYNGSNTLDVSQYFTIDENAGTATYALVIGADGGTGAGEISGSILTVTKTGTFKIKGNTAANGIYGAGEEIITLTVSNGSIEYTATDYSGTYDGQAHSISVNVTKPEGTTVTYSTDGKTYGSDIPSFTNVGTYTVYYRIMKDNYDTVEASKTVTINKKSATITAENQDIVWGNDVDRSKYTVSEGGLLSGDSITEITLTPSTTALTENGTISISGVKIENATGEDVTGNYNITSVGGTLKIAHDTTLAPERIEAVKTKTSYTAGESLNVDDLTVTAYYEDGYSEAVTGFTTNEADIDMSKAGDKILTVSYTENGVTKTKDIIVTVADCTHDGESEIKDDKAATCTEKGYTGDSYCKICGAKIASGTEISEKGHSWDSGVVTKEATEREEGEKTYTCTVCGGTKTEVIPKKGTTTPQPTATATVAPTPTAPVEPTPTATAEPTPIVTAEPTATAAPTATVTPAPTPTVTVTAEPTPTATVEPTPTAMATPAPTTNVTVTVAPVFLKKGDVETDDKGTGVYKVTDVAKKEVAYQAPANKNATTISVPATVTIDGVTYKVTSIADNAFANNKKITKVTIGSNVTTIGKKAFYKCTSLTKITIPSKVKKIGKQAFYGCKKLKTITIKTTKLTSKNVGSKAFKGIHAKATIKVPKSKLKNYKKLLKARGVGKKAKIKK